MVVFDVSTAIWVVERLGGLDKRLWRLEAMVMASTLCVVVAAATEFMQRPALNPQSPFRGS